MKTPRIFLGAGMLFWGWQTGLWPVAAAATLLLCGSLFVAVRWNFTTATLARVADFTSVLIALLGVYWLVSIGSARGTAQLFLWLPVCLIPIAAAHYYGTAEKLDAAVLFWSLRRDPPPQPMTFDPSFPYMAIWIIGAAAANPQGERFYAGIVLLAAFALVKRRPLSYPVGTWALVFCLAAGLGYATQYGLRELQLWLEDAVPDWIAGTGTRTNPYRSNTDIGHIGMLKHSDRIVLRVDAGGRADAPLLLHRASYNQYADTAGAWIAINAPFRGIPVNQRSGAWSLSASEATHRYTIHDHSGESNPVLSLPGGTTSLEQFTARSVQINTLGAVQAELQPGHFSYRAAAVPARLLADAPTAADRRMGRTDERLFSPIADELGLKGQPPAEIIRRVERYFHEGFRYSTWQEAPRQDESAMSAFMRKTHAGHCEYFATATVLLLRAAGIPARYATGFSVQEYDAGSGLYVVRERHAHAWVHAWMNDAWRVIDTTPSEWITVESPPASLWSSLGDQWSWLRFRASRIDFDNPAYQLAFALLVLLPASLWLGFRLYRSRVVRGDASSHSAARDHTACPGQDSEFYAIERHLAAQGFGRRPEETPASWLTRIAGEGCTEADSLRDLVRLHYRYRFDPDGIPPGDRASLRDGATAWLAAR